MRCAVVVLVLIGTSCHHDHEAPTDRCQLAYERLVRIGRTKFKEIPQELLDECRDARFAHESFILDCALDSESDQATLRCIDDFRGSGSSGSPSGSAE